MKTGVVKENNLAFTLMAISYGTDWKIISITFGELRKCKVGDVFECYPEGNVQRGVQEEQATVVYKKDNGVAVLHEKWGTTNEENPKDWEDDPLLIWYEFDDEEG